MSKQKTMTKKKLESTTKTEWENEIRDLIEKVLQDKFYGEGEPEFNLRMEVTLALIRKVRLLLSSQKERIIKEIGGMKKRLPSLKRRIREGTITATEIALLREVEVPYRDGWNEALSETIKKVREI